MKTTVEIPDPVFRRAKARAAERRQSLREFLTEALQEKLAGLNAPDSHTPPWMRGFGQLRALRRETAKVQQVIYATFGVVETEDRK